MQFAMQETEAQRERRLAALEANKPKKDVTDLRHERVYVIPEGGKIEIARQHVPKNARIMHRDVFKETFEYKGAPRTAKFEGRIADISIYDTHDKREGNPAALAKAKRTYAAKHTSEANPDGLFVKAGWVPGKVGVVRAMTEAEKKQRRKDENPSLPGYPGKAAIKGGGWHVVGEGKNRKWEQIPAGTGGSVRAGSLTGNTGKSK